MKFIDAIQNAISRHQNFVALEFFPPKTRPALENLYQRMERMTSISPIMCSITWGDGGSTAEETISIAEQVQSLLSLDAQVHITAGDATEAQMREWLSDLKRRNIHNLCILRGNRDFDSNPPPSGPVAFPHAIDLVRFVRREFGDFFGISVAGFPEGHPDDVSYELGLQHLKAKVDAGADLIITQMVFDVNVFVKYCEDCRRLGILCPIVPGIMPIYSFAQFRRTCASMAKAGVSEIFAKLESAKSDDAAVKRLGVEIVQGLVKALFRKGVRGVYFYTMNMESLIMDIVGGAEVLLPTRRDLPWRQSCDANRRVKEQVRPIHWAARSKSYLHLTSKWDEFPNGRWGNTQSPAFRDDATYHAAMVLGSAAKVCPAFAQISSRADIASVFLQFLDGYAVLPWSDELSSETDLVVGTMLLPLITRGFFTINSQPAINGAKSENPFVGWGPLSGYVYQKPYLEFFCPPEYIQVVCTVFDKFPSLGYMCCDSKGSLIRCSLLFETERATAVTWGVFPGQEIQQPTIVSRESFQTWAPEAFGLWSSPYQSQDAVPSIITNIQASWALVTVVDNEFTARPAPLEMAVNDLGSVIPQIIEECSQVHSGQKRAFLRRNMPSDAIEALNALRQFS